MVKKAANTVSQSLGIYVGMVVAGPFSPDLEVRNHEPGEGEILLVAFAGWCIRYTRITATDLPDGLLLDISGGAHF